MAVEVSHNPLEMIAEDTGFGDADHMRHALMHAPSANQPRRYDEPLRDWVRTTESAWVPLTIQSKVITV